MGLWQVRCCGDWLAVGKCHNMLMDGNLAVHHLLLSGRDALTQATRLLVAAAEVQASI